MAQCFWQDFKNAQCFSFTSLESPQQQEPIDITKTKKKKKKAAEKKQANYKVRCAFNKKLKVQIWASQNRDKYMHFSEVLKNNCEHNSNVTSNYLLLELGEANVLLINRLEYYLFPTRRVWEGRGGQTETSKRNDLPV